MPQQTLEDALQAAGNPAQMVRNSQIGAYVYPVVAPEFSNWRDEQRAWRETCVLFDQSHHMVNIFVEGPDALKMLSNLAINSFANFTVNKAKQFVPCSYEGYVIGDGILFYLADQRSCSSVARRRPTGSSSTPRPAATTSRSTYDDRSPSRPMGKPSSAAVPLSDPGSERATT